MVNKSEANVAEFLGFLRLAGRISHQNDVDASRAVNNSLGIAVKFCHYRPYRISGAVNKWQQAECARFARRGGRRDDQNVKEQLAARQRRAAALRVNCTLSSAMCQEVHYILWYGARDHYMLWSSELRPTRNWGAAILECSILQTQCG